MAAARAILAVAVIVVVAVASLAVYESYFSGGRPSCPSLPPGGVKSQTSTSSFGAITEYVLKGQDRWPNAVTIAPDGSVWFAEQELPGVGHLYPTNRTVVEYQWPGYPRAEPPDCVPWVSSPGIAVWNGRVWASDEFGNAIVGVSPSDGTVTTFNTTAKANFPYWLAAGPDGALWFTSYDSPARLGRIGPELSLSTVSLQGLGKDEPLSLKFVNSTLALLSTTDQSTNSTTKACICTGHVYSFNPSAVGAVVTPQLVGGTHRLVLPTSVAYAVGGVWVAQHGGSSVVEYNYSTGTWRTFPTSLIPWSDVTLPLEVDGSGNRVWFNEHYANKIAVLDPIKNTLTEYSESNPPTTGASGIQNDLSISASPAGLWFTSMSGNYVGFVDATKGPSWGVASVGTNQAKLAPGGNATFGLEVVGDWSNSTLSINASDSENAKAIPTDIKVTSSPSSLTFGKGTVDLRVKIQVGAELAPGPYTVAVTLSGGEVQQTVFLFVEVA